MEEATPAPEAVKSPEAPRKASLILLPGMTALVAPSRISAVAVKVVLQMALTGKAERLTERGVTVMAAVLLWGE